MVIERVPSVEMVRFVNSGTEACLSVVRLMRAFTGRQKLLKVSRGGLQATASAYSGRSSGCALCAAVLPPLQHRRRQQWQQVLRQVWPAGRDGSRGRPASLLAGPAAGTGKAKQIVPGAFGQCPWVPLVFSRSLHGCGHVQRSLPSP